MRKLGKKLHKDIATIEAYCGCYACGCPCNPSGNSNHTMVEAGYQANGTYFFSA